MKSTTETNTPASPDSVEREELIRHMVNRFLAWKLPKEFHPDSFISFDREKHDTWGGYPNSWPTGTNLFTADQAKQMLEYLMEGYEPKTLSNRPSREWYGRVISETMDDEVQIGRLPDAALLAATPSREWVGLTGDELLSAAKNSGLSWHIGRDVLEHFARAIESKLREKNAATPAAGSFMTREAAIEFWQRRHPGAIPTEEIVSSIIDAYAALFGDLVPVTNPQPQPEAGRVLLTKEHCDQLRSIGAYWYDGPIRDGHIADLCHEAAKRIAAHGIGKDQA